MNKSPFNLYAQEYDHWFEVNKLIFESELLALEQVIPFGKRGVEIGIGSGVFAERLNIRCGVDSSEEMQKIAKKRKLLVEVCEAESLPYIDDSFDFTVFINSLCFIENAEKALSEASRVLKEDGEIVIAFIDKESELGKDIAKKKDNHKFYKHARFHSVQEITTLLENEKFKVIDVYQTLVNSELNKIEEPIKGYGKGSFVVIKGRK